DCLRLAISQCKIIPSYLPCAEEKEGPAMRFPRRILHGFTLVLLTCCLCFASALSAADPEWKVGIAQVKITPEKPVFLSGYGGRNKPFEKVETDLYAKAMVLQDRNGQRVVLVTTDLLGFPAAVAEPICDRIREKTGLKREEVLLNSSHTHTG